MILQSANATELELLSHINVYARPRIKERRYNLQEPLVTRVALHANAQRAPLTQRDLLQLFLSMLKKGQNPIGDSQ